MADLKRQKDDLIKIAHELHQEAFDANAYFLIMEQYKKFRKKYKEEVQLSPAFYGVIYTALQKACFMEIAKLYDGSKYVITIGSLLRECQESIELFPEYRGTWKVKDHGIEYTFPIPYQHQLRPEEECFFKERVESQRKIFRLLDTPSPDTAPVKVDLTFPQFLELYQKRFRSLRKKQEKIRIQRNKIYAHNDAERIQNIDAIIQEHPISYSDIQELIQFALDSTGLIVGSLTDVCEPTQYSNIDDWEGTLILARLGRKYENYDMEQQLKKKRRNL